MHHFTSARRGLTGTRRPDRFKARTKHGNYNAWLDAHGAGYDFYLSVDPDHVPLPGFAERLLGYFRDPDVAFVVGPQVYGNYEDFVVRSAESQQFIFHSLLQRAGNRSGTPMLVGTNNAVRIRALREIGGLQDSITEDMATSLADPQRPQLPHRAPLGVRLHARHPGGGRRPVVASPTTSASRSAGRAAPPRCSSGVSGARRRACRRVPSPTTRC